MQNALNVEQARLRGLVVRRRDGLFPHWSSIKDVDRRTGKKRQHAKSEPIELLAVILTPRKPNVVRHRRRSRGQSRHRGRSPHVTWQSSWRQLVGAPMPWRRLAGSALGRKVPKLVWSARDDGQPRRWWVARP